MSNFFHTFLYNPILKLLVLIYETVALDDLGLAIIFLTILIRVVLFPLFHKSTKSQMVMQKLRPAIEKIKIDHQGSKEKQAAALLELYRQHNINPFSGFLLLVVQLPILIALYRVFLNGLSEAAFINHSLLGLLDLRNESMLMVGITAVAQYMQARLSLATATQAHQKGTKEDVVEKTSRRLLYIGPILAVLVLSKLPAAISLYWLTSTLFTVGQQYFIERTLKKNG